MCIIKYVLKVFALKKLNYKCLCQQTHLTFELMLILLTKHFRNYSAKFGIFQKIS